MVSQELLDILRCPVCVHNEPEGGELDHRGDWLICGDCDRKYPIRDDIPVMLIEEGDRFRDIPAEELPETPPPEEPVSAPAFLAGGEEAPDNWAPYVLFGAAGLLFGLFLVGLIVKKVKDKKG
ncbi:MAG: hypothetical protein JXA42_25930 [Anaerolineales bacterium]|nr:hypothetical protein [Anaerolineales bacterium]